MNNLMKFYLFEDDFGNTCGIYEGFVMAESEEQAIQLFIDEYDAEYNILLEKDKVKPKKVFTIPACLIRYSE